MLNDKGCERAVLAGICQYGSDGFFEVNDILESSVFTDISNQFTKNHIHNKRFHKRDHFGSLKRSIYST